MKITITIDEPDALREGIMACAEEAAAELTARKGRGPTGASEDELERAEWAARDRAEAVLSAWWGDDGVCRLEFDLDAGTARILRRDGRETDGAERLLAAICDGLHRMGGARPIYSYTPAGKAIEQAQKERGKTWETDDAERLLAGICDGLREMGWPICQDEPTAEAIRKAVKERGKTWGTRGHEVPDAV